MSLGNNTEDNNTAAGYQALLNNNSGQFNTAYGSTALLSNGTTIPTGVAVIVDSSGHLGTTTSSARFKEAIAPMDKASEAMLALRPVTFRYRPELDPQGIRQFGLVTEEVAKVNPDLVVRDEQGKPYTVR